MTPLTDPLNPASAPLTVDTPANNPRVFTPVHDAWDSITNTPVGFFGTDVNAKPVGDAASAPNSISGRAIQRAIEAAYNHSHNGARPPS